MTISGGTESAKWTGGTVAALLLSIVAARVYACRSEAPETAVTVRDSAGVEIVESHAPAWSADGARMGGGSWAHR
jgi:hypothetical protein